LSAESERLYATLDDVERDILACHADYQRIEEALTLWLAPSPVKAAERAVALGKLKGKCIALHGRLDKLQLTIDGVLVGDRDDVRSQRKELNRAVEHLMTRVLGSIAKVQQNLGTAAAATADDAAAGRGGGAKKVCCGEGSCGAGRLRVCPRALAAGARRPARTDAHVPAETSCAHAREGVNMHTRTRHTRRPRRRRRRQQQQQQKQQQKQQQLNSNNTTITSTTTNNKNNNNTNTDTNTNTTNTTTIGTATTTTTTTTITTTITTTTTTSSSTPPPPPPPPLRTT
jgi:hypothetical protein